MNAHVSTLQLPGQAAPVPLPADLDRPLTTRDLEPIATMISKEIGTVLRAEMAGLATTLRAEMVGLATTLRGEMAEQGKALRGEMAQIRGEINGIRVELTVLHGDVGSIRTDLLKVRGEITEAGHKQELALRDVKEKLSNEIGGVRVQVHGHGERLLGVVEQLHDLRSAGNTQSDRLHRATLAWCGSAMAMSVGASLAAVKVF